MRRVREVTADEENFRLVPMAGVDSPRIMVAERDPVRPEPVGTLLLVPMRIVGYDLDCDGSLMARFQGVSLDELDNATDPEILNAGLETVRSYADMHTHWGLYPTTGIVATPDEIRALVR